MRVAKHFTTTRPAVGSQLHTAALIYPENVLLHTPGPGLDPQRNVAAIRAGRYRDTTGYNPRSKIIEGGSWTRVELHRELGIHALPAA